MTDVELEAQIEAARIQVLEALAPAEQRLAFARMADLIKQRSPEQVRRMEQAKGLR